MMMHGFYYGWGMGYGWIFWLIILIFGIWLSIITINRNKQPGGHAGSKSPMDILKERYARGEIRKEEFDIMKKDLQ